MIKKCNRSVRIGDFIEPNYTFEWVKGFSECLAVVKMDNKLGLIVKQGNFVIKPK